MGTSENAGITIVISGGMVHSVYTTLDEPAEVEIIDFGDSGTRSDAERTELNALYARVLAEQKSIY